jgi:hypothetical protein
MNKKQVILIVFVLLLISGGVFLYQKEEEIKGSPDDYIIEEKEQGRIVKNEKAGFSIKVPEEWKVKKIGVEEGSMVLYSPNAKGIRPGTIMPPLEEGCMIEIAVIYEDMSLERVKEKIMDDFQSQSLGRIEDNYFEHIEVGGEKAIKNYFYSSDLGINTDIYIKKDHILYGVGMSIASSSEESCLRALNIFLNEMSFE